MVVIKIKFPDSVRRINPSNALEGFATVKKCIDQELKNQPHVLSYIDADNDKVTVGSYDEFSIALSENVNCFSVVGVSNSITFASKATPAASDHTPTACNLLLDTAQGNDGGDDEFEQEPEVSPPPLADLDDFQDDLTEDLEDGSKTGCQINESYEPPAKKKQS